MFRNTEKLASLIYRQTMNRCVPRLPLKKEALHLSSFSGFNAAATFVFQKIPLLGPKTQSWIQPCATSLSFVS